MFERTKPTAPFSHLRDFFAVRRWSASEVRCECGEIIWISCMGSSAQGGEGLLPFAQVLPKLFAELWRAEQIEHIVSDLECHAECCTIGAECSKHIVRRSSDDSPCNCCSRKEPSGLASNHAEVVIHRYRWHCAECKIFCLADAHVHKCRRALRH